MPGKAVPKQDKKFTAVVYFHGMGSQKRYEEVSRLVDALDHYDFKRFKSVENKKLVGIEAFPERPLSNLTRDIGFIEVKYRSIIDTFRSIKEFRFYEAYWANLTAGGNPPQEVLWWLLKQTLVPIKALVTPWRGMARLRRSILLENWDNLTKKRNDLTKNDLKHLIKSYHDFEGPEARRKYPRGSGRQFRNSLKENRQDPNQVERLAWAARQWWGIYARTNLLYLLVILSFLLAVGLILYILFITIKAALPATAEIIPPGLLSLIGEDSLKPSYANIIILISALFSAVGVSKFLKEYMGDVYFWCTYEETAEKHQRRRAILDHCAETLKHVLLHKDCERVVIVAHSLGTTIAFDTILELSRTNRAIGMNAKDKLDLGKIQHFITMASPIDKVHYFFENQTSQYHRYNRVVEQIRGDLASYPFSKSGAPLIHWMNFWDKADIISGSLQTPATVSYPSLKVDNCEAKSFLFPFPDKAHSAYFDDKEVIEKIYQSVFENMYNFPKMRSEEGQRVKYSKAFIGETGHGAVSTRIFQVLTISLPWVGLTNILAGPAWNFVNPILLSLIGITLLGAVIGLFRGHVNRL